MTKVRINGQMVDLDGAAALMDDDIREQVNAEFIEADRAGSEEAQNFANRYCQLHREKFGEEFVVN